MFVQGMTGLLHEWILNQENLCSSADYQVAAFHRSINELFLRVGQDSTFARQLLETPWAGQSFQPAGAATVS